jgi:hypothetical protein
MARLTQIAAQREPLKVCTVKLTPTVADILMGLSQEASDHLGWTVSSYGERYLRPLVWAAALLLISTISYLWLGLEGKRVGGRTSILSMSSMGDWLQAAHYSFRTMTFLKPEDVATPIGYSRAVHTVQSLLGPLFLGLFALAVRQRLKR